jgi:large subunit ribosomal protein L25
MELLSLNVKTREANGKGGARKKRAAGLVPVSMYGEDQPPVSLEVEIKAFDQVTHGKLGEHALVQVTVEDQTNLSGPIMIRTVQHHPVSDKVLSADFQRISLQKPIITTVPLKLVGQCRGLLEGGIPEHTLHSVQISALPLDVPDHVDVEVTNLSIGGVLHVSDIVPVGGVTILTAPERAVIAIKAPRVSKRPTVADAKGAKKAAPKK